MKKHLAIFALALSLVVTGVAGAVPDAPCGTECTGGGTGEYNSYFVQGIGANASCWCIYDIYKPWKFNDTVRSKVRALCNHNTSYVLLAHWKVDGIQAEAESNTAFNGSFLASTYKTWYVNDLDLRESEHWYRLWVSMSGMSAVQSKYNMVSPSALLDGGLD